MRLDNNKLNHEKLEDHFRMTDDEFEQLFASCQFPPELFTHEAHLRLAWIHITRYGIDHAIENVCSQIKAYTVHLGETDKYHDTVTVAAVRVVYHFTLKSASDDFAGFIREFSLLNTRFRELLSAHYSTNIFTSEAARQAYLEPDLAPFD